MVDYFIAETLLLIEMAAYLMKKCEKFIEFGMGGCDNRNELIQTELEPPKNDRMPTDRRNACTPQRHRRQATAIENAANFNHFVLNDASICRTVSRLELLYDDVHDSVPV